MKKATSIFARRTVAAAPCIVSALLLAAALVLQGCTEAPEASKKSVDPAPAEALAAERTSNITMTDVVPTIGISAAHAQELASPRDGKQPNILVIWGDDVGISNISVNTRGLMGYQTPNIDRIAREACRSSTITASSPARRDARPSSAATTRCALA